MIIEELVNLINKARIDYYNGQSTISDSYYDSLIDQLSVLDPKNPAVIGIGAEPVSNWEKYSHKIEMGSLNKAQTEDEYKSWHEKYNEEVLLTLKLDGLSVSLIYENGVLTKASSRGNGTIGELITANVIKMQGVPLRLPNKISTTIRGEILLSKENHKIYFPEYSNPRNAASGISRRFDGEGSDKLTVIAYQLFSDDCLTFKDQFDKLSEFGFIIPPYHVFSSYQEVFDIKNEYQSFLREKYDYVLDGLVIHINDVTKHTILGSNALRPYGSIAFKFDSVVKEANISDILIQVGNSGRITPVAIFNPKVNLMGAEVEKASLHNFSNIKELGVGIGAKVLISRRNDVIPFVEEVIIPGQSFEVPIHCPQCSTDLINVGEYVQCPNYDCPAQITGRVKNWIKELNILEWGDGLLEKLCISKVKTIADLYKLSIEDLSEIERMGKKSATKCYQILHDNKEIALDIFLGALSIPMIGSSTIRLLMDAGYNLNDILNLNAEQIENVKGIGPIKAKSLVNGLNKKLIEELLTYITIKEKIIGKLTSKSVCFTGTMVNKRNILEQMVIDAGGSVKSSVGKGLSYLVIADVNSTSSKAIAAKKLGTTLISEEDFLKMVQ